MKVGIMQPYFLPYLGYWQLLSAVDEYVIYDDVNFIKGGWIPRNRILVRGEAQYIRLELEKPSPNRLICDIGLNKSPIWRRKLLKTIEMAYHKAPYYHQSYSVIQQIMEFQDDNLSNFLSNSIKVVCKYLQIKTNLQRSSRWVNHPDSKGEARVLDICERLGGTEYYNAVGGKSLYSGENFRARNLSLFFVHPMLKKYSQLGNEFIEGLSILDIMMFNSVERIQEMLKEYHLEKM